MSTEQYFYGPQLKHENDELKYIIIALLEYIDALPGDVVASLPAMPGIDRDYVNEVIEK